MLEIKMISLIGIVVITSYIGFLKANTFVEREKEINLILTSLNFMKNKIEYTNMYLRNIFLEISNEIYKGKDNLFKNTIESKLSLRNGFKESANVAELCIYLRRRNCFAGRTGKYQLRFFRFILQFPTIGINGRCRLCAVARRNLGMGFCRNFA